MLDTLFMTLLASEVTPETTRLGVYVLSGIVGLTVSGAITIGKDIPKQAEWLRQQSALARLDALECRKRQAADERHA